MRRAPRCCSSCASLRLTVGNGVFRLRAAPERLPASATATNSRMASNRSMFCLSEIERDCLAKAIYSRFPEQLDSWAVEVRQMSNFDVIFSPSVKKVQAERGARKAYARREAQHDLSN